MYGNPPRPNEWDGYDVWQWISYGGTIVSVLAMFAKPKLAGQLGKMATGFGVASAVHAIVTPPKCVRCGSRMSQPQPRYRGGPEWLCRCGNALYPGT